MSGIFLLLAQAVVYFMLMAAIFYKRRTIGIGVFFCILGTMHFLETYLAAVFFIELPFGLISPGSTVMFAGKLALFLLLYIKEDAESMRQPTYGLLAGNLLVVALALILRLHSNPANLPGYNPDLRFLDQMGLLMVWGTTLLFFDLIALVVLYERLRTLLAKTVPGRIFASLAIVLSFDQMLFYAGLHLVTSVPTAALYGGWVAKMGSAAFFTLMLTLYLRHVEPATQLAPAQTASDVFDRLTYRHRYERLVKQVGRDALTGLPDRGQFDAKGPDMLRLAARSHVPVSLMMIDIDRFKEINDRYGHPTGDRVICDVVATISRVKRERDDLFRYGGDEFALLCLGMPADAVSAMAERIISTVAGTPHPDLPQPVTISIGVASFPANSADFPTLLRLADEALYRAKALGRNRTASAGAQPVAP